MRKDGLRGDDMEESFQHIWCQALDYDKVAELGTSDIARKAPGNGSSYLILTPKHFIAMAASKNMAAEGKVSFETAKNDALRWVVCVAHTERR